MRINFAILGLLILIIVSSCATSSSVSKDIFHKRKYSKGWFYQLSGPTKLSKEDIQEKNTDDQANNNNFDLLVENELLEESDTKDNVEAIQELDAPKIGSFKLLTSPKEMRPVRIVRSTGQSEISDFHSSTEEGAQTDLKSEPFGLVGMLLAVATILSIIVFLGASIEAVPLAIVAACIGFVALVLGIVSIIRINDQPEKYKGKLVSILSILSGGLLLFFSGVLFFLIWAF